VDATPPKELLMSTSLHAPGRPYQHPPDPAMSLADWVEDVAFGLGVLIAMVLVAGILALLIII
jgi:hypothetical protein